MSAPNYDYATYRHIVETKFIVKESNSENPLQPSQPIIETRKPHHPQYSQKNKRYECGCGFKGEILNFTIIPNLFLETGFIRTKSQKRLSESKKKQKARNLLLHEPRRNIKMVGSEIIVSWS